MGFGGGASCLGLIGARLGRAQLGGHFLGGRVGPSAPLIPLRGALLGGGANGFHLGFGGGGRVGDRLDGRAELGCDVGDSVGFNAQQAQ